MWTSSREWLMRWGPAILVMTIIFCASNTPGDDLPDLGNLDLALKKGGHMLGYALLGAAYLHAAANRKKASPFQMLLSLALAILYACSDEYHQSFIPGRSPAASDIAIDTLGASVGITLWGLAGLASARINRAGVNSPP